MAEPLAAGTDFVISAACMYLGRCNGIGWKKHVSAEKK